MHGNHDMRNKKFELCQ